MGDFVMFFCCRVEFVIDRNMFYSTTNTSIWKLEIRVAISCARRFEVGQVDVCESCILQLAALHSLQ